MYYSENNYKCNSICTSSMFYFIIDIDSGRPYYACYGNILDISRNVMLVIGVLSMGNFLLLFISRLFFDDLSNLTDLCKVSRKRTYEKN